MKRAESLWSVFGNCFLESWKFFYLLSEWTTFWKTLKVENWRYWKHSLTKSAYFNFSKNICVSSNIPTVLFFFLRQFNLRGTLWQYASSCQRKLFIGHSHVSGFLFPAVRPDIIVQNCDLSSPSNLVHHAQCCSLHENIYGLKLRVTWRFHKLGTRLIFLKRLNYKQPWKNSGVYPRC